MMPTDRTCLLLSIQPTFADAIFEGRKRVELRRTRPKLRPGDIVLVYVTVPHKVLRGVLRVVRVVESAPESFWSQVEEDAGVRKEHFDEYFSGARNAFGIHFDAVRSFARPVTADELRREGWADFQPPQSYRYLRSHEIECLEGILEMGLWDHLPAAAHDHVASRHPSWHSEQVHPDFNRQNRDDPRVAPSLCKRTSCVPS